ncbi:MAG TPA: AlpA family phage regulatory protein [Thermoanaerobaculia bacterium]|nr:AlpA family phage regulatory protein [Thermoanaerobaculia bacterium]
MTRRILRLPEVKAATGKSRSTIYLDVSQKLFPPAVRLGARMVGWPEDDIAALNAARIRGASDDEIRALIAQLTAARRRAS